jgi:uncharacterized membrane protein
MSYDPRLDDFERRLRELESELAELRALSAAAGADSPVEPVATGLLVWAEELLGRGDFRGLFREVERARRRAVGGDDIEALLELNQVAQLAEEWAPVGVDAEAARLGYTIRQNIRFVARKLHVEVDEAALRGGVQAEPVAPEPLRAETPPSAAQFAPRLPRFELPDLTNVDLFGAKALAIAGGIVTLLGIVFFFVLAVNRGWIGPEGRIGLGALAAVVVYAGGLELRRRYGETYSSLAGVAAGIAGGYGVLLAAAALYDFLNHAEALVVAAAIAGVGLATALRWRSQMIAGLGLLGAMLAPLAVAAQDGLSVLGIAFVAFMAVATATVAIRERWDALLVLGALASLPQALALAMQVQYRGESPGSIVTLSAVFSAIAVGTGIARQLRARRRGLGQLPTPFLFAGAAFAVVCALRLYGSPESQGFALLAVAIAFGVLAAILFRRKRERDLSALLGALGLLVGGIAFGELMSGSPLAFAWAGEAAVLAWLSRRVREIRYQLFALVYFAAALVHVLAVDVTPAHLFKPLDASAAGALAVVAVGLSAAVIAWQTAPRRTSFGARRGFFALLVPLYRALGAKQRAIRIGGYWLAGLAAVYAVSLGVLAAVPSFGWGHAAMYSLWSVVGIGTYAFGLRRGAGEFRGAGLVWLVLTAIAAIANGQARLSPDPRAAACLVAGAILLAATLVELFIVIAPSYETLREDERVLRLGSGWAAGVAAVAALSVGLLAAVPSFDWGRVSMFSMWSAIGLGVLVAALRRQARQLRVGALSGLAVTLVGAFATGERLLGSHPRGVAFLVVGAALVAAALADQLVLRRRGLTPVAVGLVLADVGMGLAALVALFGGSIGVADELGLAFLGLAALHAVLAAAVYRLEGQRDFATLLWGAALVLGYGSSERLLPGTYHVLVLSLAAVGLGWLALRVGEPRFLAAASVSVLVGVATVIFGIAPPSHLFRALEHPGHGALGALFVAIAAVILAHLARETVLGRRIARAGWWTGGVLVVYGLSILILALFQASFSGSVDTNFHRGHTAVSAFWGLIGLALLYFGLTRLRALRVAGFAMFTVSLAKIFVFDLPSLSSVTRALSFLAVGAVLLLGGFFYQRLATAQPAVPRSRRRKERTQVRQELHLQPVVVVALVAAAALIVWFGSGTAPLGAAGSPARAAVTAGPAGAAAPLHVVAPHRTHLACPLNASGTPALTRLTISACPKRVSEVTA